MRLKSGVQIVPIWPYIGKAAMTSKFSNMAFINFLLMWVQYFLPFSIVFPKTALFITLKMSFSNLFFAFLLSLVFISVYGFSKAFWLNLITLWIFFKSAPWFVDCFKFLMWVIYLVLSCQLVTKLWTFPKSFWYWT